MFWLALFFMPVSSRVFLSWRPVWCIVLLRELFFHVKSPDWDWAVGSSVGTCAHDLCIQLGNVFEDGEKWVKACWDDRQVQTLIGGFAFDVAPFLRGPIMFFSPDILSCLWVFHCGWLLAPNPIRERERGKKWEEESKAQTKPLAFTNGWPIYNKFYFIIHGYVRGEAITTS